MGRIKTYLTGCSVLNVPNDTDKVNSNSEPWQIVAYSRYVFNEVPSLMYQDDDGNMKEIRFSLNDNSTIANFNDWDSLPKYSDVSIYGTAEEQIPTGVEVDFSTLENCTHNIKTPFIVGSVDNWIINCADGYVFKGTPYVSYQNDSGDMVTVDFILRDGDKKATLNKLDQLPTEGNVYISADIIQSIKDNIMTSELPDGNFTHNIPKQVNVTPELDLDWFIKAKPNHIITECTATGYNERGDQHEFNFLKYLNDEKTEILINGDYNSIFGSYYFKLLSYTVNTEYQETTFDEYGSINVYKVTPDNLAEFAKARFIKPTSAGVDTTNFEVIDLGSYVHSIKRTYFKLEPTSINTTLKCGDYDTKIIVDVINQTNKDLDFGVIKVPLNNQSAADYENTQLELFLPFVGFVNLSNDYLGSELRVIYKTDIVNSSSMIFLYSDGMLFQTINCNVFTDVIYRRSDDSNATLGALNKTNLALYGLTPFLKIKWFKTLENDIYNADNRRLVLTELKGWYKIHDIEYTLIDDNITNVEVELLNKKLSNGVQFI